MVGIFFFLLCFVVLCFCFNLEKEVPHLYTGLCKRRILPEHLLKMARLYVYYCSRGERLQYRIELNSEYHKDSWGFLAKEKSEGVSG